MRHFNTTGSEYVPSVIPGYLVIERCYCRLKDFRRIATRYDKLARNYFSALCHCRRGILALVVRGFRFWDSMASVSAPG
jgi:hypothetical protein